MTPRRLLLACFLLLLLTLVIKASPPAAAAAPWETRGPAAEQTLDCGGEPCDAVLRGLVAFFDRRLEGLDGNGRSCADCHMPTDRFQLSPANAEARFQLLQWRRRWNPDADDPLFRPIDADDFRTNGESASDFSNLRQNGLIRITFRCRRTSSSSIPRPTCRPPRPSSTSGARFRPSTTSSSPGPTAQPVAARPEPDRWLPAGWAVRRRCRSRRSGALINHAQIQNAPPQQLLDDLASFQRVLFTNHRVRALSEAIDAGTAPLPDPGSAAQRARAAGQGRVRARVRAVPRRSLAVERRSRRSSGSTTSPPSVRARSIRVDARSLRVRAVPAALARNARTYEITLANGTTIRRTSSDPGPRAVDGVRRAARRRRTTGTSSTCPGCAGSARPRRTSTTTAPRRSKRSWTTTSSSSSEFGPTPASPGPLLSTNGIDFDRPPTPEQRASLLAYLRKL